MGHLLQVITINNKSLAIFQCEITNQQIIKNTF